LGETVSETKSQLIRQLQQVTDALRAGVSAAEFSRLLYSPDVVVVGEGWPGAIRGTEAFLPELATLLDAWGPNADVSFTIIEPFFDGADVATTLVNVYVAPSEPTGTAERYRAIYTWKQLAQGWRVAAEMYTVGSF
jgi:hypothetical protein